MEALKVVVAVDNLFSIALLMVSNFCDVSRWIDTRFCSTAPRSCSTDSEMLRLELLRAAAILEEFVSR